MRSRRISPPVILSEAEAESKDLPPVILSGADAESKDLLYVFARPRRDPAYGGFASQNFDCGLLPSAQDDTAGGAAKTFGA